MESILNELYHHFYQPLELPECKVLLRLVDAQNAVANKLVSYRSKEDSFAQTV